MLQRRVLCFLRRKSLSKRGSEGHETCFFVAEKLFDKFEKHAMIPINNYKIMRK